MIDVRDALEGDRYAVARVHVRSWQAGYRGLIGEEILDAMSPEDRAPRYTFTSSDPTRPRTIVALEAGAVVGFATFGVPAESAGEGELFALYVDPDHWRTGVGSALIVEARHRLTDMSCARAALWVLEGNERAMRFYERDGWNPTVTSREDVVWGVTVVEQRFVRDLHWQRASYLERTGSP